MKQPMPRPGSYLGMPFHNNVCDDGTWIEDEARCYPNGGMTRLAYVTCPDGKKRVVRCGIPDTWFSVPAVARIAGRTVRGFVSDKDQCLVFTPYQGQ